MIFLILFYIVSLKKLYSLGTATLNNLRIIKFLSLIFFVFLLEGINHSFASTENEDSFFSCTMEKKKEEVRPSWCLEDPEEVEKFIESILKIALEGKKFLLGDPRARLLRKMVSFVAK